MDNNRTLYLLTATFPYGTKENFLEIEIDYLCKFFDKVVIIPLIGSTSAVRRVPVNCIVELPIINNKLTQYLHLFSLKSASVFFKDFFLNKVFINKERLKTWFIAYVLTNNYLQSQQVKTMMKNIRSNDVVYSYWGKGGCYLAPIYKGKALFVSRFHGEWDLWEESSGNYAPIRKSVVEALKLAIFISKKGELYFKERYLCPTVVSRLGCINPNLIAAKSRDGVIRIVSCSSVYPLKRVPLIFNALQLIKDREIIWTHIGGGVDFEKLEKIVAFTNKNIHVKLLGQLSNPEVLNYYASNPVDVFINVSTNEGIPVSIMEAISYNIPVIGTNVGGTSEIVTHETGILLSPNPSLNEIKEAILKINSLNMEPRAFWKKYYNAEDNYSVFAKILLDL